MDKQVEVNLNIFNEIASWGCGAKNTKINTRQSGEARFVSSWQGRRVRRKKTEDLQKKRLESQQAAFTLSLTRYKARDAAKWLIHFASDERKRRRPFWHNYRMCSKGRRHIRMHLVVRIKACEANIKERSWWSNVACWMFGFAALWVDENFIGKACW